MMFLFISGQVVVDVADEIVYIDAAPDKNGGKKYIILFQDTSFVQAELRQIISIILMEIIWGKYISYT